MSDCPSGYLFIRRTDFNGSPQFVYNMGSRDEKVDMFVHFLILLRTAEKVLLKRIRYSEMASSSVLV